MRRKIHTPPCQTCVHSVASRRSNGPLKALKSYKTSIYSLGCPVYIVYSKARNEGHEAVIALPNRYDKVLDGLCLSPSFLHMLPFFSHLYIDSNSNSNKNAWILSTVITANPACARGGNISRPRKSPARMRRSTPIPARSRRLLRCPRSPSRQCLEVR